MPWVQTLNVLKHYLPKKIFLNILLAMISNKLQIIPIFKIDIYLKVNS